MRREAYISWPFYGPILEAISAGRLVVEPSVTIMPGCWITVPGDGTARIGRGTYLNCGVMIAAYERVQVGEYCLFANGCFITDADHRYDDPEMPIAEQGYRVKGPTTVGDHVWCGVNVAIMGGVTIGDRCIIGANSVVTHDLEPYSIAAGSPAQVLRRVEYGDPRADVGG
jgi:acetyltransferase-like isoleucine patch superfamily enzyme